MFNLGACSLPSGAFEAHCDDSCTSGTERHALNSGARFNPLKGSLPMCRSPSIHSQKDRRSFRSRTTEDGSVRQALSVRRLLPVSARTSLSFLGCLQARSPPVAGRGKTIDDSTPPSRRSPRSYFETNDCGLPRRKRCPLVGDQKRERDRTQDDRRPRPCLTRCHDAILRVPTGSQSPP